VTFPCISDEVVAMEVGQHDMKMSSLDAFLPFQLRSAMLCRVALLVAVPVAAMNGDHACVVRLAAVVAEVEESATLAPEHSVQPD